MAQGGGKSPPQLVLSMTSRTSRRFPEQRLTREEVLVMLSELIPRPPACGEHLSVLVRQVVRRATGWLEDVRSVRQLNMFCDMLRKGCPLPSMYAPGSYTPRAYSGP
jgi:hypothetical protein